MGIVNSDEISAKRLRGAWYRLSNAPRNFADPCTACDFHNMRKHCAPEFELVMNLQAKTSVACIPACIPNAKKCRRPKKALTAT